MKNHSQQFIQQRKLYMALPLLATPFLLMIFWALGGGTQAAAFTESDTNRGLNTMLPEAQLEGKEQWDKLSLYDQAKSDSMRYEEARENDPYFDLAAFKTSRPASEAPLSDDKLIHAFPHRDRGQLEQIEQSVQEKINQLQKTMAGNHQDVKVNERNSDYARSENLQYASGKMDDRSGESSQDVQRMEQMMQMIGEKGAEPDEEMQQIEGVLDKILDIQHPERVKQRLEANAGVVNARRGDAALKVSSLTEEEITWMGGTGIVSETNSLTDQSSSEAATDDLDNGLPSRNGENGFFGLVDHQFAAVQNIGASSVSPSIKAVVHDTQILVAGATVRLRLAEETSVDGIRLPKDHFIFGNCEINGERLVIKITAIRYEETLLPVAMTVYDLDGLEGIHVPGAITREAAKQGSADAIQSMQMMSLNPSIGAQAAGAGIEAAKGLLTKKARLVKVTVKAGYQVLLRDSRNSFQ